MTIIEEFDTIKSLTNYSDDEIDKTVLIVSKTFLKFFLLTKLKEEKMKLLDRLVLEKQSVEGDEHDMTAVHHVSGFNAAVERLELIKEEIRKEL